jgi:peptidoglycan/LPS O-acetylase OafA/YrhL
MLFHAFPEAVPGGFVGVDIFFVVSGYLITGILLESLDDRRFSLVDFYRRRVRRIFPALLVVLVACLWAGWLLLFQPELAHLGKHVAASAAFVQNFALWKESGYFDAASETKPLLHLWSLAVEEQFYLIWPLLLWAAWKSKAPAIWLVGLCAIASFAAMLVLRKSQPIGAFYSPLSRFWELLAGAAIVCAGRSRSLDAGPIVRTVMSVGGFVLLLVALLKFDGKATYPGWQALLPVTAAGLIVAAGPSAPLNRWVLTLPALVAIGLISYPLYLWHWPLLSFARLIVGATPTFEARTLLLAISVALATLTFVAIEKPLRFGSYGNSKSATLAIIMIVIGLGGLVVWQLDGLAFRYISKHSLPTGLAALSRSSPYVVDCIVPAAEPVSGWCYKDVREEPRYALLGDSHAEALFWALVRSSAPDRRWIFVGRPDCAPIVGFERLTVNNFAERPKDDPLQCAQFKAAALDYVLRYRSVNVVVIVTARRVLEAEDYAPRLDASPVPDGAFQGFGNSVAELRRAGKEVVFVTDNPYVANSEDCAPRLTGWSAIDDLLARHRATCQLAFDQYLASAKAYAERVSALEASQPGLVVFDAAAALCDRKRNICPMIEGGQFLYSYGDHLSTHGGDVVAAALLPVLRSLDKAKRAAREP